MDEMENVEIVEVDDTATDVVAEAPATKEDDKPNREALIQEEGWSAEEADKAVGMGLAKKEEKPEPVEKKAEAKPELTPEQTEEKRREDRRRGEKQFDALRGELTKEQEEAFFKIFPPGTPLNGPYLRMKSERARRQQVEREAQQYRSELEALKKQMEVTRVQPRVEVDENGNEIDPDDKPLTLRQIKEMQQKAAEEAEKQKREVETRAETLARVHEEQEAMVTEFHPDFKDVVALAKEIAADVETIEDPAKQKWARKLMKDFAQAAQNADKLSADDLTAPELAYEIGKLHPKYGQKNGATNGANADAEEAQDGTQPEIDPKKGNGGQKLTPDQLERLRTNTQRRPSSASIPGSGGHRTISPDDVTLDDLNRMSSDERIAFKDKYKSRFEKLIR